MKLYILRHAHSPSLTESGLTRDEDRILSAMGRADALAIGRYLAQQGAKPQKILTSPFKRAVQTAEAVVSTLDPKPEIILFEPLSNKIAGGSLWEQLRREVDRLSELLIVGHQPQLGEMVGALTGQEVPIRPGGLVALETTGSDRATLVWTRTL